MTKQSTQKPEENIKPSRILLAQSGHEPYKCFQCNSGFALKKLLNKHYVRCKGKSKNYVNERLAHYTKL